MGQDKNWVSWSGQTFLQHVASALEAVCTTLILIKSAPEQRLPNVYVKIRTEVLVDAVAHAGPAASAQVGLDFVHRWLRRQTDGSTTLDIAETNASEPIVFLTGNDSPLLQPALLQYLVDRVRMGPEFDAAVPRQNQPQDDCHPLCAAYKLRGRDALQTFLEQGGRSLKGWLTRLHVDWVTEADLRTHDPDLRSLLNLNTPADLAKVLSKPATDT
jgi:molybdopterin-guanine dinucleotide biosynthesis protein A